MFLHSKPSLEVSCLVLQDGHVNVNLGLLSVKLLRANSAIKLDPYRLQSQKGHPIQLRRLQGLLYSSKILSSS